MKKKDYIVLYLDYGQMGLGGVNSWREEPLIKYQLLRREYSWGYVILPF